VIIDFGETWSSPIYEVRDVNGALGAAVVTYVITSQVDGSPLASGPATAGATGQYTVDWPAGAFSGQAAVVVTATGGVLGAATKRWTDLVTVDEAGYVPFVSVDECIRDMRAALTITTPDDVEQLRWITQAACDSVEKDLGVLISRRTVTDYFDGGGYAISLRKRPLRPTDGGLVTIGSVTENGVTLNGASGYFLRRNGWALQRGSNLSPIAWWDAIENVTVTYTVSTNPVPRIVRKVAMNTVRRMWQASQQAPLEASDSLSIDSVVGAVVGGLTAFDQRAYNQLRRIPGR
jgi:hypothetical protein